MFYRKHCMVGIPSMSAVMYYFSVDITAHPLYFLWVAQRKIVQPVHSRNSLNSALTSTPDGGLQRSCAYHLYTQT